MKLLAPIALMFLVISASADVIIETKIESPQINTTATTKIKGSKMRTDLTGPMGAMSSIMETTTGDAIQLIHAQKMAMKINAEQMKAAMEMANKAKGISTDPLAKTSKPVDTGKTEKVGDYDCEIYSWKNNGTEARYWIATNHPQAALLKEAEKMFKHSAIGTAAAGPDMSDLPGPAIKTEMTIGGTKTVTTVLSVKEAPVDASEFEMPKDYQDMSAAMGGAGSPAPKKTK
jgi:hypothetical protein